MPALTRNMEMTMPQAADDVIRNTAPNNVLVQSHPADTLTACNNTLALVLHANDGDGMSAAAKDGMQWVMAMVMDALRHEASRAPAP